MFSPTKVLDVELTPPLATIEGLDGYGELRALVRLHGTPLGYVDVALTDGRCPAAILGKAILDQLRPAIVRHLVCDGLAIPPRSEGLRIEELVRVPHPVRSGPFPLVTVAVCTRDRTSDLARCLESLSLLDYPALDLLVIDNAPSAADTEHLVRTRHPNVRYVCEPRPGLDWARNRAIREARGEIIAYTDDDVVADTGWVRALAAVFAEHPEVMAVTGLVVPYEMETEAQVLFERYGGFGRGFVRGWYRIDRAGGDRFFYYGTGHFGTGANMAYRRNLFAEIGEFDPALDVGTVTNGGGDLEMFFRVLKEGHTLVYEPAALVRHRHRREYEQLEKQIRDNGVALASYFVRSSWAYPEERLGFLGFWLWWVWWRYVRSLCRLRHPPRMRALLWAELRGVLVGVGRFPRARRHAADIARAFAAEPTGEACDAHEALRPVGLPPRERRRSRRRRSAAVRIVELSEPLAALTDVVHHADVRLFATWKGRPLGQLDIANHNRAISTARLRDALATSLGFEILDPERKPDVRSRWAQVEALLARCYLPPVAQAEEQTEEPAVADPLPAGVSVSIVVATYDRPGDLRDCLSCLTAQVSPRRVEIIVVDNHPASGLTAPVVAEFPHVVLVQEPRRGVAYARNAGIAASQGDIVVTVDDDVTMPPEWLERLLAPFARGDVMAVTGNVLPRELDTPAQRLFEIYGGLSRGFAPRTFNRAWFDQFRSAVPTWELGGTANAAFRATVFSDPAIGLMDEALGPGMPSGVGEDTYIVYAMLKTAQTIVYEPTAYVWHKHRRDMPALRRQLYNYSKGHVAYHLTTLLRDHDWRALVRLGFRLPQIQLRRLVSRLLLRSRYPLSLLLAEIAGNLVGPWALLRSRRRVRREGCSAPYVPVARRAETREPTPSLRRTAS